MRHDLRRVHRVLLDGAGSRARLATLLAAIGVSAVAAPFALGIVLSLDGLAARGPQGALCASGGASARLGAAPCPYSALNRLSGVSRG